MIRGSLANGVVNTTYLYGLTALAVAGVNGETGNSEVFNLAFLPAVQNVIAELA
jgi:hypothetical protein